MTIRDEADFILKVRNRYHKRVNNEMAVKIQKIARGFLTRRWFEKYGKQKLRHVIRIQSFYKSWKQRSKFLAEKEERQEKSALLIQRFVKGYMEARKWVQPLHRAVIGRMMAWYRAEKFKQDTAQIKLRWMWKRFKRRKEIKLKEKKRKAAEKAKKDKKKFGGRRTVTAAPAAPSPEKKPAAATTSPDKAAAAAKAKVKEAEGGIIDLQVGTMKDGEKPEGENADGE